MQLQFWNYLQRHIAFSVIDFWIIGSIIPGVASTVRHNGLPKSCVTDCDVFASNQVCVSRSSTVAFFVHLALKTNLVQPMMPLCIEWPFGSLHCDGAHFQRWVAVTSSHLDISSVWKLLVASCVCVWLKFEFTFQCTCLQHQNVQPHCEMRCLQCRKCTSPAQNALSLVINIIVSDECICLQCDIVFRCE